VAQLINNIGGNGFPYAEYVEDEYPGDGQFIPGEAGVTVVFNIPSFNIKQALLALLGFSVKQGGILHRDPPLGHPLYPWMYANKITRYQPYQFNGGNSPANSGQNFPLGIPFYADYNYVRVWVQFSPLPYPVLPDAVINGDEFNRYVEKSFKPRGEAIQLDRGVLGYKPVAPVGLDIDPPKCKGNKICEDLALGISKRIIRCDVFWTWHMVPEDGAVSGAGTGIPAKQLALLGTVNQADFHGYPAKTLLLQNVEMTPHNFGMESDFATVTGSRYYDIKFQATYWRPSPITLNLGDFGDWNFAPYRDGTFREVQFNNNGNPLYEATDWTTLFTLN
jgi:hypothetical protein